MTNHTDTSRSGDLVKRLREMGEHPCRSELPMGGDLRQAADHIEAQAQQIDTLTKAHDLWCEKTEWVQTTAQTQELGLHRADVLRLRIEALEAENERLRAALRQISGMQDGEQAWYARVMARSALGDEK